MIKKIVIAGGTGFIGKYFKYKFQSLGYEVFIISRQEPHIQWQDKGGIVAALENSEMLINLAGKQLIAVTMKRIEPKYYYREPELLKHLVKQFCNVLIHLNYGSIRVQPLFTAMPKTDQ